jgi:hypothetical protein
LVNIKSIKYSVLPKDGLNIDEFDFKLKISKEYFGAESSDV